MITAALDYARPADLEEALSLLSGREAMLLAGGQSLIPALSTGPQQPKFLVDISRLEELRQVEKQGDELVIGAAVTLAVASAAAAVQEIPLLATALASVGSAAIRSRGTLIGNLVSARPNSELPVAIVALGGRFVMRSAGGRRVVDADDFFLGPHRTVVTAGEIVTELRIPMRASIRTIDAFSEVSARSSAPPLCCVALCISLDADDTLKDVRIVVGGVTGRPARCHASEGAVAGHPAKEALARLSGVKEDLEPALDLHDSIYASEVAPVLIRRAVADAVAKLTIIDTEAERPA